jgi:hypothetical protein
MHGCAENYVMQGVQRQWGFDEDLTCVSLQDNLGAGARLLGTMLRISHSAGSLGTLIAPVPRMSSPSAISSSLKGGGGPTQH